MNLVELLRHHVTGAIERGEKEAIIGITEDDLIEQKGTE